SEGQSPDIEAEEVDTAQDLTLEVNIVCPHFRGRICARGGSGNGEPRVGSGVVCRCESKGHSRPYPEWDIDQVRNGNVERRAKTLSGRSRRNSARGWSTNGLRICQVIGPSRIATAECVFRTARADDSDLIDQVVLE